MILNVSPPGQTHFHSLPVNQWTSSVGMMAGFPGGCAPRAQGLQNRRGIVPSTGRRKWHPPQPCSEADFRATKLSGLSVHFLRMRPTTSPRSWWWKAPLHGGDWCSHKRQWLFPQILHHRHSWLSELNNNAPSPPTKWLLSKFTMFQLLTVINCYSHCITIWRAIVQGKLLELQGALLTFQKERRQGC